MIADESRLYTFIQEMLGHTGKRQGNSIRVGRKGSLSFLLTGSKAGIWSDFESGDKGDLVDYLVKRKGFEIKDAFAWLEQRGLRDEFTPESREKRNNSRSIIPGRDIPRARDIIAHRAHLSAVLPEGKNGTAMDDRAREMCERDWFEVTGTSWTGPDEAEELLCEAESIAGKEEAARIFPIINSSEYLTPLEPTDWILPGLIESHQVGWIFGSTGSYKSLVCLHAAVTIANGLHWFGQRVQARRVLYCFAEGQAGIKRRLHAYLERHNVELESDNLFFCEVPLRVMDGEHRIEAFIESVIEQIPGGVELIFLDTYNAHRGAGEENSNDDAAKYHGMMLQLRGTLDTAIVTVHHTGKDAEKGMRGASAFTSDADFAIAIHKPEGGGYFTRATAVKTKESEAGKSWWFTSAKVDLKASDGSEVFSFAVEETDEETATAGVLVESGEGGNLSGVARAALILDRLCVAERGPVQVQHWRSQCIEAGITTKKNAARFMATEYLAERVIFENGTAFPRDP